MKKKHPKKIPFSWRWRLVKVYVTAIRIGLSYLWLKIMKYIRGNAWVQRKKARVHLRNARRAERTILEVKGLFVKLGQLLSIMTNFLPEAFRRGLQGVQDQVPTRAFETVRASIEYELGSTCEELFTSFDPIPIASASLAQVHRATLIDGTEVAVKVRHLNIEAMADMDLTTFRRILKMVNLFFPMKGMDHAYTQIREMIMEELDFSQEARHLQTIAQHFEDDPNVDFPKLMPDFCRPGILTTTFEHGIKISDISSLETAGLKRQIIAERIVDTYCQMLFVHGVFHADPHPGNLLVRPDGTVVFLDFGAIGHLTPVMKRNIPRFLEGLIGRNEDQMRETLIDMGFINPDEEHETIRHLVAYFRRRFLENIPLDKWKMGDLNFDLKMKMEVFAELKDQDVSIGDLIKTFQYPKDWIIIHRTLILLLGLISHVDPKMNPLKTMRPYLQDVVIGSSEDWVTLALRLVRDLFLNTIALPKDLRNLIQKLHAGEVEVKVAGYEARTRMLRKLGNQGMLSVFTIAGGFLAYTAFHHGHHELSSWALKGTGISAVILILTTVISRDH